MQPGETTRLAKTLALEAGFDLVGVSPCAPSSPGSYYKRWLAAGHAGPLAYLHRHVEQRCNPQLLLPGARSVICVALNYYRGLDPEPDEPPARGRVARYARGCDYHQVVRGMLGRVIRELRRRLARPFEYRVFVDTGPVLERELAAAAGLGWIGRNTMLVHPRLGSYLVLGEVLTTLELETDRPMPGRCGQCRRCLEACPTGALIAPYRLDAGRCISCLTIEQRGRLPEDFHAAVGRWVFGCDVCQEVCPYNRRAPVATQPEISAERLPGRPELLELLTLRSGGYRRLVRGTAGRRATRNMWRRNAAIALGNADRLTAAERQALLAACQDPDPGVRAAAREVVRRQQLATPGAPPARQARR